MITAPRNKKYRKFLCLSLLLLLIVGLMGCGGTKEPETPITSISDLNGKIAVMQTGTVYSALLKARDDLPDLEITYSLSQTDALAMLLGGKADAYVTDYAMARILTAKYDSLCILEESLDKADYGFAFRKEDPIQEEFSAVIREMKADGRLKALQDKWLGDDQSVKTLPEQDWPGLRGTLNCQVSPEVEPLCYPDGMEVTGLDVDLLLNIAKELDYHITFTTNRFYDMLPSLVARITDIVASALTITEERLETVDFTEPYLDASAVVVVRNGESSKSAGLLVSISASFNRVFVENDHWKDLLLGLVRTILITLISAVCGTVLGALLYLWEYSGSKLAERLLSSLSWILTMMPTSTFLMIMYYIIFAGKYGSAAFWAATTAFTILFGFSVFGALRSSIGSISAGQTDAAYSMGYSKYRMLRLILFPQAIPGFLSEMESTMIYHIRDTSLVGMITVLDIQQVADLIRAETLEPFFTLILTAVVYILLDWGGSSLVRSLRISKRLREKPEDKIRERIAKGKIG